MPRFFVNSTPDKDGILYIDGDDARHIALSLRMAKGECVTVASTDGMVSECELTDVRPELVALRVRSQKEADTEPPCRISVYVACPKGTKLDTVIQKATELGASEIIPFVSERCVSRPDGDAREKKSARYRRIAYEAAKQCGRAMVPEVLDAMDFKDAVRRAATADFPLFLYEAEHSQTLGDAIRGRLSKGSTVSVMTGAEGGFSPREAELAVSSGMIPCGLGRRILRCETAPLCVLSALLYESEL